MHANLIPPDLRAAVTDLATVATHRFAMPGWHVWDGCVNRLPTGRYALFFSRWPESTGHKGWIDYSEICRAEGPYPWGPFTYVETIFTRTASFSWDAHNFHNVTVKAFGGGYYLYYTGNYGNGDWWDHRNHQRIGVAVAESLTGPWRRFDRPIIDISPGAWDSLCVANPSVCETADGRYLMVYKGVTVGPPFPFGSRVLHGVAVAANPAGPFIKQPGTQFNVSGVKFPFEDPYVWREGDRYRCLIKDMEGVLGPCICCNLLFESDDGLNWDMEQFRVVSTPFLRGADGVVQQVERLERPSYCYEAPQPCLSFAVKPFGDAESYLVFRPETL
jgi:hypothetical protein